MGELKNRKERHTYVYKEEFACERKVREVLELLARFFCLHYFFEVEDGPAQRMR
jgi:hypothetical protein